MKRVHTVGLLQQQEAQRRLKLLGQLADAPYDYQHLRRRAKEVCIPAKVLWHWLNQYQEHQVEGLLPAEWNMDEMTANMQVQIEARLAQLASIRQVDVITPDHLRALASANHWSLRTTLRWVQRYQIGGWWGLAPRHDPEKEQSSGRHAEIPALGVLDDDALEKTFLRRGRLGKLISQTMVSRTDVARQAAKGGISPRTVWRDLHMYRQQHLAGLAPKTRSDKGSHHKITSEMIEVVRGVRFDQPGKSVRAVYETVIQKAQILGEVAPSRWQVRQICAEISQPERFLAEGRDDFFRNNCEVTRSLEPQRRKSTLIVYQIDPTRVNLLIKDLRKPSCRSKSGMVRPWLTVCFDSRSRLVLAAIFTYDHPDRYTIAAAIRDAVLAPLTSPYGGIPHEIWIDHGKELLSHHVEQLTQELSVQLHKCHRHRPQEKGLIERFFRTLNTRFWSTQPGYVGSNVVERNPHVKAVLTMQELERRFWQFIEGYHHEVHSQTQEAPLAYWKTHCYAESADPRKLDILLQEPIAHKVQRTGIHTENRVYWDKALATRVGSWVVTRAAPHYQAPEQIEVFQKRRWICTAKATDTLEEEAVGREEIVAAKHEQKAFLRGNIKHAREAVAAIDRTIAAHLQHQEHRAEPPAAAQSPRVEQHAQPVPHPVRPSDVLDAMASQQRTQPTGEQ